MVHTRRAFAMIDRLAYGEKQRALADDWALVREKRCGVVSMTVCTREVRQRRLKTPMAVSTKHAQQLEGSIV